jgi:LysR family transcriptional regulator, transcriptional activator of nhaA
VSTATRRSSLRVSLARLTSVTPIEQEEAEIFPVPTAFEAEFQRVYDVKLVGRVPDVRESFYAISVDRKLKHPAVIAVSDTARRQIFR